MVDEQDRANHKKVRGNVGLTTLSRKSYRNNSGDIKNKRGSQITKLLSLILIFSFLGELTWAAYTAPSMPTPNEVSYALAKKTGEQARCIKANSTIVCRVFPSSPICGYVQDDKIVFNTSIGLSSSGRTTLNTSSPYLAGLAIQSIVSKLKNDGLINPKASVEVGKDKVCIHARWIEDVFRTFKVIKGENGKISGWIAKSDNGVELKVPFILKEAYDYYVSIRNETGGSHTIKFIDMKAPKRSIIVINGRLRKHSNFATFIVKNVDSNTSKRIEGYIKNRFKRGKLLLAYNIEPEDLSLENGTLTIEIDPNEMPEFLNDTIRKHLVVIRMNDDGTFEELNYTVGQCSEGKYCIYVNVPHFSIYALATTAALEESQPQPQQPPLNSAPSSTSGKPLCLAGLLLPAAALALNRGNEKTRKTESK